MDNRGKPWTTENDQQLMDNPHWSNGRFSQIMGRSENAIKFRRSHIAVKMFQQNPDTPLEEFVGMMGADILQAETLMEQARTKQSTNFPDFLPDHQSKKRLVSSPFFPQARESDTTGHVHKLAKNTQTDGFHSRPIEEKISLICSSIQEEQGRISHLWNDKEMVPYLVQFQIGFDAYARYIQAQQDHLEITKK